MHHFWLGIKFYKSLFAILATPPELFTVIADSGQVCGFAKESKQ